jgi:hypothetical protein
MGMMPLVVNTAFEAPLLKSARSKWAQIDQHVVGMQASSQTPVASTWFFSAASRASWLKI